jgi:hypothetical protein
MCPCMPCPHYTVMNEGNPRCRNNGWHLISSARKAKDGVTSFVNAGILWRGGIMGILDESEDHRKTVHWKRNSPSGNNPAHIYTSAIPPAAITYPQGAFSHAVILSILLSQSRDPV